MSLRRLTIALATIGGSLALTPAIASAQRIVVEFKDQPSATAQTSAVKAAGAKIDHRLVATPNTAVVNGDLGKLRAQPGVKAAWVDGVVSIPEVTPHGVFGPVVQSRDTFFTLEWGLNNTGQAITGPDGPLYGIRDADVDAPEAWRKTTGRNVTVWVADTGIDYNHPDLRARYAGGYDFVDHDSSPFDQNGHGTHVSGTIAATYNNYRGVAGLAPNAKIRMLRVLDASGSGYWSDFVDAMNYAGNRGARIFSASLGGQADAGTIAAMQRAVNTHPRTMFVFAAGNEGYNNDVYPNYPSNLPGNNVIAVAASDNRDGEADFSNIGRRTVDLFAPGVDIASTFPGNRYVWMSGTSMATPHVAGAAALVRAKYPAISTNSLRARLFRVDHKSQFAGRVATGGRLNAYSAVR